MIGISSPTVYFAVLLILLVDYFCDGLVIYRRKPKPKLICHEEFVDEEIVQPASSLSGSLIAAASGSNEDSATTKRPSQKHSGHRHGRDDVREKREIEGDIDSTKNRSTTGGPNSNEPVIRLGTTNDDEEVGGFEIVSENLTAAEKALIRQKLVQTCHALNLN